MGHARHWFGLATAMALVAAACGGGGGGGASDDRRNPVVFTGNDRDVPAIVEEFRTQLGRDNGGVPERGFTGRREIDWDSIPDEDASPASLSPDYYNGRTEPFARGIRITAPDGDGVQVSADADNPTSTPVRFGNFNPTYPLNFETFSAERLMAPIGNNVVDAVFTIPGSPDEPALVRGFGAVFTHVEGGGSKIELFAEDGTSLGDYFVPSDAAGLSFLGILFDQPVIARVRITYGNSPLGPTERDDVDVTATDDFIYAEPQPQD